MELSGRDDLVEIGTDGTLRPLGDRAAMRLQARAGALEILPSPPHLLFMKRADEGAEGARPCILSGELRSAGALCDVLSFVGHAGWRGEFVVQEAESARSIYFDQGNIVGAQSTLVRERLGEVLYARGVLTREQLVKCSDATATGEIRFGEAAVHFGFVTREKLFDLMAHQTEEIFYGLMLVGTAMFYFLEGYDEAWLSARQKLSVTALMRDGIQRMHETRYFRARIPSPDHVPVRVPGWTPPDSDPLGVYEAIDGTRSVVEICRVCAAGDFEVTRALFQFAQAGRVVVKPRRLPLQEAVEVFNQAIAFILRELDAMDEGDGVREQLLAFVAQEDPSHLLASAGPADDGTYRPAQIAENASGATSDADVEEKVAGLLHRLGSYALFLARPHLRRLKDGRSTQKGRFSERVAAMLEPIAPKAGRPPDATEDGG